MRVLFRKSFDHVERYAADWSAANERALATEGPLWVVLGDSAAQGVGASSYERGWVGVVLERLRADGTPWRVVNLSRSGARTREVLEQQWPLAGELEAALVTAVVGGNDARLTRRHQWERDAADLVAALPPGAVMSTTARGLFERKTAAVNARIRVLAAERGLRLADLWEHTGPPYRGLYFDGLHPNDKGYLQWADAVWSAVRP